LKKIREKIQKKIDENKDNEKIVAECEAELLQICKNSRECKQVNLILE
jgi:hypothetical protein